MRRERSIEPDYFEALYREKGDPWSFESSPYEAAKYDRTLASLPAERLGSLLEVGCANGVLTARLGKRCDALLAVDVSETALETARRRCADQPHIRIEKRQLPQEQPQGCFDLILLSEVLYYWDSEDLARTAAWLIQATGSGGHILLVHWIGETDYPKSGDAAVNELRDLLGDAVGERLTERHECYRLDLWRRR
jgi:SAM-dependent methyltransferase